MVHFVYHEIFQIEILFIFRGKNTVFYGSVIGSNRKKNNHVKAWWLVVKTKRQLVNTAEEVEITGSHLVNTTWQDEFTWYNHVYST